jgi:hypothetical protein
LSNDYRLCTALKQYLDSYKFQDHRKMERVVMQWLITQNMGFYQQEHENLLPRYAESFRCGGGLGEKLVTQHFNEM